MSKFVFFIIYLPAGQSTVINVAFPAIYESIKFKKINIPVNNR